MGAVIDRLRETVTSLLEPPVPLASAWVAWLTFGLVLAFWYYRARKNALVAQLLAQSFNRPLARTASGVRPPVKAQPRPDAFEELQTLLDGTDEITN